MYFDLTHNRILESALSPAFREALESILAPKLRTIYGDGIEGVTMYEDFLADDLVVDGECYYPLTVTTASGTHQRWIKWNIENKKQFESGNPYAYIGEEPLELLLADILPDGLKDKVFGRAIDYEKRTISLRVDTVGDPMVLVGKYSQSFVDEMARQITLAIERTMGVEGLADSTIELRLTFATGSFMEHTSDNVTYRRLLLTDKGCQARDFWVKWTRLDSDKGYTVSDHPAPGSILFEIGEGVPQKIREKEFRFLCRTDPDKYQAAMGKRTATEWRSLIKRAIKNGDLIRVATDIELATHADRLADKLREIAGNSAPVAEAPIETPTVAEAPQEDSFESELDVMLRRTLGEEADFKPDFSGLRLGDDSEALFASNTVPDDPFDEDVESTDELDTLDSDGEEDEPLAEEPLIAPVISLERDIPDDEYPTYIPDEDPSGEPVFTAPDAIDYTGTVVEERIVTVVDEEAVRAAREREEEARQRLEIEANARAKAEEEARLLREERERIRAEYEMLLAEKRAREEREQRAAEEARLAEERRIAEDRARAEALERERLAKEQREREEELERIRVAEAARIAIEEQRRIEAERAEREAIAREEILRAERERLAREEAERREAEARMEAERRRVEEQARQRAFRPVVPEVEIVTKHAKILFRRNIDMNIIKRIREIVEATLISEGKASLNIHMKAYSTDSYTINLDIKVPSTEVELVVTIVKAIGNGGLGITKIILE